MEQRLVDANALRNRLSCTVDSFIDIGDLMNVIDAAPTVEINGDTSDGYHTFNELYHHRAVLFAVIVNQFRDLAWKSRQHDDGSMFEGMFIVGINTPKGQATYHYDLNPYWSMFDCKELDRAPKWDGHTPQDAIERIGSLCNLHVGDVKRG